MRAWLLVLAACHGGTRDPAAPPTNRVGAVASLLVAADQELGWLALGPAPAPDATWLPVSARLDGLTLTDDPLPPRVTVVGVNGAVEQLAVGDSLPLKYGCDDNELGVHPLTGARLAPGPAWILPPDAPPDWRPAALLVHRTQAAPTRRTHVAGGLVFTAARRDTSHATFTIARDGREVLSTVYERAAMDGADTSQPLDLADSVPGIAEPLAVWSLAPAGPFLVVLLTPGYEGVTLSTLLVEDAHARAIDGMELYLYACAF